MTSPSQKTYVEKDLPKIRAALPALGGLSDGEVENLYREFSEQTACAGWLAGPETEGFGRWALLSPVQRLRATKSDEDPPVVCICLSSSDWATIHGSLHAMAQFFRDFAEKTPAYRARFLAMAADHLRVQSEMIAQQPPNHSTGWVEQPEHALADCNLNNAPSEEEA